MLACVCVCVWTPGQDSPLSGALHTGQRGEVVGAAADVAVQAGLPRGQVGAGGEHLHRGPVMGGAGASEQA